MPELDGIEVFGVIREISPEMPVILMSGNIPAPRIEDLRNNGLREVLRKPCSDSDVLKSVRRVLDESR